MNVLEIEKKIEQLYEEYRKKGGDIRIMKRRKRALQIAREIILKRHGGQGLII